MGKLLEDMATYGKFMEKTHEDGGKSMDVLAKSTGKT
jgi:hypothetical protein